MARRRAHLSQRELAERLGCRQATIARWERGQRQPSFADVQATAAACRLQLDSHLVAEDRSWWPQIAAQLDLDPVERVRSLTVPGPLSLADDIETLAQSGAEAIVIGEVAGALHGWPLVLIEANVKICTPPHAIQTSRAGHPPRQPNRTHDLRQQPGIGLIPCPPGTAGFADLARGAQVVQIGDDEVRVASLLDLIRIADTSPGPAARRHALAYQAVLDVHRARREAPPENRSDEEKIQAWLSQQTPVV